MRQIAPFGSRFVLQARLMNMSKFLWIIVFYAIANPFLYLMAIGVGVGTMIDSNTGSNGVDGVSYIVFLAPALLANAAIQGSMDEVIFPTLAGFMWEKVFFSMNSTPLKGRQIALGVFQGAMVRNFFTIIIYYAIMWAFGVLETPHAWLIIPTSFFAGAAFSAIMLGIAGNTTKEDNFFTFIGRFILQPMFFLSGTFFPLDSMPIYLRWVGWISPLWHATDLGRYLSYGRDVPVWLVVTHILVLLLMLVGGLKYAFYAFEKRLLK
jgi:lipooligosaccharide transport system permease protein